MTESPNGRGAYDVHFTRTPEPLHIQALRESFDTLVELIGSAVERAQAEHKVERALWDHLLRMGREAMSLYFHSQGNGDEGESVRTPDGRERNRLKALHSREYLWIFGEFELSRVVYGTREGQKIEYVPLDMRLQLPRGKFSYLLQEWNHSSALEIPFAQVSSLLERILGFRQSVNSLERSGRWCAESVAEFWEDRPAPSAEQEGELLVCSVDGKGVAMRRSETETGGEAAKPSSGMRPGDKKMGLAGSVYTVDRYPRTPQQLVEALFRTGEPSSEEVGRPKPCFNLKSAVPPARPDIPA